MSSDSKDKMSSEKGDTADYLSENFVPIKNELVTQSDPTSIRVPTIGPGPRAKEHMCFASRSDEDQHHARLGEYTADLWKQKCMTDIMIVVQNKKFIAHKSVLACYSPYFKNVLLDPAASNVHHLELSSVTAHAFQILLTYMYTGELYINCQEMGDVYRAARRLGMKDALQRCVDMLSGVSVRLTNTLYIYVTAKKLGLKGASERAFKVMTKHFEELATTKEFLDLDDEQICEFLSADEIGARSEVIVFLAALSWINYRFLQREKFALRVMKCVRFPMMTMDEILACYHPPLLPGLVLEVPLIRNSILKATCYIAAREKGQENLFKDFGCEPRTFTLQNGPVELWDTSMYDPDLYEEYRKHAAATVIQSNYKGYMTRKSLNVNRRKSKKNGARLMPTYLGTKSVDSLFPGKPSPGKEPKSASATAMSFTGDREQQPATDTGADGPLVVRPSLYTEDLEEGKVDYDYPAFFILTGGLVEDENAKGIMGCCPCIFPTTKSNALLKFDVVEGKWSELTPLPSARVHHCTVYLDNYIYCIGGCDPHAAEADGKLVPQTMCYRFDMSRKKWTQIQDMTHARNFHSVVPLDKHIYAIGGKDPEDRLLNSVEYYDPLEDAWVDTDNDLECARMAMGCTIFRGCIWIAGGMVVKDEGLAVVDNVDCFDPAEKKWSKKANLPVPISFTSLTEWNSKLYSIGGAVNLPGRASLSEVTSFGHTFQYEFVANAWRVFFPLPYRCHSVIATTVHNAMYILGGLTTDEGELVTDFLTFDVTKKDWVVCAEMPLSVIGYATSIASPHLQYIRTS